MQENSPVETQVPPVQVEETPVVQPVEAKKPVLMIVLVILFVLSLMATAFLLFQNMQLQNQLKYQLSMATANDIVTPTPVATADPMANWKTYNDSSAGFLLKYPMDWTISQQGAAATIWQSIDSPNLAPAGSQSPIIGMNVSIQTFSHYKDLEVISNQDLKNIVTTDGVLSHYKVTTVQESFITKQNKNALSYEYQATEYPYHFWGLAIANGNNIVMLNITDFKADQSLNTKQIADQILSTFMFTN